MAENRMTGSEHAVVSAPSDPDKSPFYAAWRQAQGRIEDQIKDGGFAVALSGGGHRATLSAIGALLALVDRGLNRHVLQIASISGGSITNAFVAQRCDFKCLAPGGLDDHAAELVGVVVRKGVLTRGWITAIFLTAIAVATTPIVLLEQANLGTWGTAIVTLAGLMAGFGAIMFGGHVIEWLLDRRYFSAPTAGAHARRRIRLGQLPSRSVDHVFGMTDLVLGMPVSVSMQKGGMVHRWLGTNRSVFTAGAPPFQTFAAPDWTLTEVVRASAAFPGIPPRRVRMPSDTKNPAVATAPTTAFLADGGIWNNLGTQILREGRFLGTYVVKDEDGVLRPYSSVPQMPVLVINGSAPQRPSRPWLFYIPCVALLNAFFQVTQVLSVNAVQPRVSAMENALTWRIKNARRPDPPEDPLDVVVDLRDPDQLWLDYGLPLKEETIRASDPVVKNWECWVLSSVRLAFECRHGPSNTDWLEYILEIPEPEGSYPLPGFAEKDGWDAVCYSSTWKEVVRQEGQGHVDAPTTLGRIAPELARRIIARGYLNTFLGSLYLGPLGNGDLERLASLSKRLDCILPESAGMDHGVADMGTGLE